MGNRMKAIVLGGTSGIGKSIALNLKKTCDEVISVGRKEADTSSLKSIKKFTNKHNKTDILVLNTGGPPDLKFHKISNNEWQRNFNKLFLSFVNICKDIKVNDNGYIFLISSFITREPSEDLIISSSIRSGFISLFKSLSRIYKNKKICFINIAPGPIKTERLKNLLKKEGTTLKKFEKTMPTQNIPEPNEIGLFVNFVVKNKIKSFNGVTIPFDSGLLKQI